MPRFLFSILQASLLGWSQVIERSLCLGPEEGHELGLSGLRAEQSYLAVRKGSSRNTGAPLILLNCRSELLYWAWLAGVNFLYSSLYGAVCQICDENRSDNAPVLWLSRSSACTVSVLEVGKELGEDAAGTADPN